MPKQAPPTSVARRPRVDAQRNRERILQVAREAFTQHGPEATLDDIARRAKIGPGTLYRHFSSRDALIEAVFRDQVEKLTAAGQRYAITMRPLEALRAWMLLFIEYVACKLLILPAMDTVPGGSVRMIEGTRGLIHSTFGGLVQHAVESGDLRAGTDPNDIIRAFIGVFHTTALPDWESSARRIADILIDGSRAKET
jgi:AcrR family transcriptional regulator